MANNREVSQFGSFVTVDNDNNVSISTHVGINTSTVSGNSGLVGIGNSMQGIYVSNGMIIMDNHLEGNHYIGTEHNGIMAGPVNVNGSLYIDGVWVVV